MAWFRKKEKEIAEEGIQELPELPNPNDFSLPELPNSNEPTLPELPEPDFNMESENMPQLPRLPELRNKNTVQPTVIKQEIIRRPHQEMQKSQFGVIETRQKQELPLIREINEISPRLDIPIKNVEPVYVRLDKFESSLQSIEEIKRKITEVEETLKKTKDIKQKEEQELEAWEREIHLIKSRIDTIDKTIFNKLD